MSVLRRFLALYALMYAAFGVSSPFLPAFFAGRGLRPEEIGILFAAGTAVRLVSGALGGRLADLTQALRIVLAACAALAALAALTLLPARGFAPLFTISVLHAAALAPITTLADANQVGIANAIEAGQILVREAIAAGDLRERFPGADLMRGGEMVGACRHTHHTE